MSTLEKIKTLLSSNKEESKEIKMYAEAKLDDGRVIATEDEKMDTGSEVYVIGDDGETSKLSAGTYTLEDGAKITIDEDSKIAASGDEEAEAEKEEMAEDDEADVQDWAGMEKRIKNLEDGISDLKKAVYGEDVEEKIDEEEKKEMAEDEKVEMSKDMVNSLVEEVEHLKAKIVELEKEPGSEGFAHNPESNTKSTNVNLVNLTHQQRVRELITNLK